MIKPLASTIGKHPCLGSLKKQVLSVQMLEHCNIGRDERIVQVPKHVKSIIGCPEARCISVQH